MKNKYAAIIMGMAITAASVSSVSVYAENTEAAAENTEAAAESVEEASGTGKEDKEKKEENATLGEVKAAGDGSITIAVGTRKEKPGDDSKETTEETAKEESSLELTGEELTITVTDDTVITKNSMQKPEGEAPAEGEAPEGEAPAEGEAPEGEVPQGEMPAGETITLSDIQEGDIVSVTMDEDGNALTITVGDPGMGGAPDNGQGGPGGPGGMAEAPEEYVAANEYTEDTTIEKTSLESTGTDENAALISQGANTVFDGVEITRTSSESKGGDTSSFYGVGAALLAEDGTALVKNSTIMTDAAGGAGLFAYGNGTVYAADSAIKTSQDTSGGIHAAGGGTLYAWNLDVETDGESSAAIRSDRGGGTMVVDSGKYVSNGVGSPAVYCTADIAVNNAELTANGSEAVCIEGLNSLHLYNTALTGNMSDDEQNDTTWTVILYQSMSGDSEVGNSTFQMDGGSLTSNNGGLFYTTNTESTIALKDVDISANDDSEFFLQCTGNNNKRGWGTAGDNGADCHFTAQSQEMKGDVIWDSISDLDFYITDGSTLTGSFLQDETYAGGGGDGYANVYVSEDSTWTVTGDSKVTSLANAGTVTDEEGKTVTVKGEDGTVYVEGDSDYTITAGSYTDTVDLSGATTMDAWSDYETERPAEL